ncbi:CaiB/BaiF CoA transferase family protein [Bradyrhizobium zhanjiangense]|uniref:CoA transferase n=1 Tax=Bradyrhizobium zhanjiangense TaxID=1325107 RepID=A0A4Q0Q479_9BRAD|nr:CaiB/BaiF CoA-transferase family protein [Bradyrhizobium zhanjiangense]RXG83854.1 CoA transferase [Bradyrhizobium zhanjiangense]
MTGCLTGLRVLDLSRVLAGPWAGQIFADLGAEVIKVERPDVGDDTRGWGPPFLVDQEGRETSEAAYFLSCNRGKKSITIDIRNPDGQDLVRKLAAKSDFLLENYKVGGLAKYGLSYQHLRKLNPGLIYCSITGFGQDGPYKDRAGYDFMIQAMGGLMSVTGLPDGMAGAGPVKVGVAITDLFTGMYATVAMLAALEHRRRTGEGQWIDLSLLDVQVATLANQALNYLTSGDVPRRLGNAHPNIAPYEAFPTSDGYMILAVGNDDQFSRFCSAAGRPDLSKDPRFATNSGRVENRRALIPQVAAVLAQHPTNHWLEMLEIARVPCGPINALDRVFKDPQVKHRRMCVSASHAAAGKVGLVASPIKFSNTPVADPKAPPLLGEHTDEILADLLGISRDRIEVLRTQGSI